jgi:hypothetical protein
VVQSAAAAGILASGPFGKVRTGTIRRKLIHVPARIATSGRGIRLHLPQAWPWQTPWQTLFEDLYPPPQPGSTPPTQPNGAIG